MTLTVVILTKNEERHITRALASVSGIADRCVVVDSGSDDRTVELAKAKGAKVLVNPFVTQAQQFNWALDQLPGDTEWVLRLDADEIVTE
ncbi:glycosyltransferase family 2 protein, partial [bacterium]|nr:glycosyltransferase family 2 protein [bacterium]